MSTTPSNEAGNDVNSNSSPPSPAPPDKSGQQAAVMNVLMSALDVARTAVGIDDPASPPDKVLPLYDKAIDLLDGAMRLLPVEVAESTGLRAHRESYATRAEALRVALGKDAMSPAHRKRQQSRVPFEQLHLDPNAALETAPTEKARRPYWVMRLIKQTITQGGHLTQRLFVPKGVWAQVGVKFSAFQPKIQAMEMLLYMLLEKVLTLPKPIDEASLLTALTAMRAFREALHKIQSDMCRTFPFISEPELLSAPSKSNSPTSGLGKINSIVRSIGRNVKNQAVGAYERIGSAVPGRATDDELVYYSQLVSEVCGKCQIFDDWILHVLDMQEKKTVEGVEELLQELQMVSIFMQEVILEIVLRDLESLMDRYLHKMRKSFSRIH